MGIPKSGASIFGGYVVSRIKAGLSTKVAKVQKLLQEPLQEIVSIECNTINLNTNY